MKIIFAFLLLMPFVSFAQSEFVKDTYWSLEGREKLPEWFFNQLEGEFIGISDPCLKHDVAIEQAMNRAAFLYLVSNSVNVGIVADYFSMLKDTRIQTSYKDKYISLASIEARDSVNIEVVDSAFTKYSEAIVRVRIGSGDQDISMNGNVMLVNNNDNHEKVQTFAELQCYTPNFDIVKSTTISNKISSSSYNAKTFINSTMLNLIKDGYWYNDNYTQDSILKANYQLGRQMRHSIWNALMEDFVYTIINYPYPSTKTQQLDDTYGKNESSDGNIYSITRLVTKEKMSFSPRFNAVYDNRLFIDWNTNVLP